MESFKLATHGNKPISKSVSLFPKCSSCTFMGRGCQKHYDEDALGILRCSIRNPVKKEQMLEVGNAWQRMRKIKQTENMKNKIIWDLVVLTDSGYNLSQQRALETNPSTTILGCIGESTASRPREAILPSPAGFVSPPEQEGFDILDKVQWRILVARREVCPRSHYVFQFPKGKVQREHSEPILERAAICQEQRSCSTENSNYKWRKYPSWGGETW